MKSIRSWILDELIWGVKEFKNYIVQLDPQDIEIRQVLNFGHTIGHAIENFFHYETYTHGEAISIGMARITEQSEALGITEPGTAKRLIDLIKKFQLPVTAKEYNHQALLESITLDKKVAQQHLNIILLAGIGKPLIKKVSINDMSLYL